MNHDMLYLGKILLNIFMYGFGDGVCFPQSIGTICRNLHVYIYFITENAGLQQINAKNLFILHDTGINCFFGLFITGMIYHFIHGIFENIIGSRDAGRADDALHARRPRRVEGERLRDVGDHRDAGRDPEGHAEVLHV